MKVAFISLWRGHLQSKKYFELLARSTLFAQRTRGFKTRRDGEDRAEKRWN